MAFTNDCVFQKKGSLAVEVKTNSVVFLSLIFNSCCLVTKLCSTFMTPCTVACQGPLSMDFSRQEYWSGLLFPSPGYLPSAGIEPKSPALAGRFFTTEPAGKPLSSFLEMEFK